MVAKPDGGDGVDVRARGNVFGQGWEANARGYPAGYAILLAMLFGSLYLNEGDIPRMLVVGGLALLLFGFMAGYHVGARQVQQLLVQNDRLAKEVERIANVKSKMQKKRLTDPMSSEGERA